MTRENNLEGVPPDFVPTSGKNCTVGQVLIKPREPRWLVGEVEDLRYRHETEENGWTIHQRLKRETKMVSLQVENVLLIADNPDLDMIVEGFEGDLRVILGLKKGDFLEHLQQGGPKQDSSIKQKLPPMKISSDEFDMFSRDEKRDFLIANFKFNASYCNNSKKWETPTVGGISLDLILKGLGIEYEKGNPESMRAVLDQIAKMRITARKQKRRARHSS